MCQASWSGMGCNVVMETECDDNADNDGGKVPVDCGLSVAQ